MPSASSLLNKSKTTLTFSSLYSLKEFLSSFFASSKLILIFPSFVTIVFSGSFASASCCFATSVAVGTDCFPSSTPFS